MIRPAEMSVESTELRFVAAQHTMEAYRMGIDDRFDENLEEKIDTLVKRKGVSRRSFLKFCGAMVATLGLEATYLPKIAEALVSGPRPPFIWLQFAECTGCTEAFLRSSSPFIDDLLLNKISLEYHETIMAPAGAAATKSLEDAVSKYAGKFFVVTEGAIPLANSGNYGMIGGKTMLQIAQEVCPQAKMMISLGTCASYGGLPKAAGGLTGAECVHGALNGQPTIKLPGCPPNPVNFAAVIINYLLFSDFPRWTTSTGRPLPTVPPTTTSASAETPPGAYRDSAARVPQPTTTAPP